MSNEIANLQSALREFACERDWEQFHSPKNLASALSVEAAELLEHFQWLTEEQSRTLSESEVHEVGEEMADVFLYLLQSPTGSASTWLEAARAKMARNAREVSGGARARQH